MKNRYAWALIAVAFLLASLATTEGFGRGEDLAANSIHEVIHAIPSGDETGSDFEPPLEPVLFPGDPDPSGNGVAVPRSEQAQSTDPSRVAGSGDDLGDVGSVSALSEQITPLSEILSINQIRNAGLRTKYAGKNTPTKRAADSWLPSDEDDANFTVPETTVGPRASMPYELRFVGGTKSPAAGIDPAMQNRIETRLADDVDDASQVVFGFLMHHDRLLRSQREQAEALGVEFIQRHPYRSWKVSVPLDRIDELMELPFVYWFGNPDPQQKLDPAVQHGMSFAPYSEEPQRILVNVMADDTSEDAYDLTDWSGADPQMRFHSAGPMEESLVAAGFQVEHYDRSLMMFETVASHAALQEVLEKDWILFVEYEATTKPLLDQSSPLLNSDHFWDTSVDGEGVSVGIIDTGVYVGAGRSEELDHMTPCGVDFLNSAGWWDDERTHGTHVTGIMASNASCTSGKYRGQANGIGAGTNLARYRVAKAIPSTSGDARDALDWMETVDPCSDTPKAHIVNNSWGSSGYTTAPVGTNATSRKVDEQVYEENIVMVFSAGNGLDTNDNDYPDYWGPASLTSPAVCKNSITVGSTSDEGQDTVGDRSSFSSQGPTGDGRIKPELNAPGSDDETTTGNGNEITSTHPSACGTKRAQGTSMAAPHVTGSIATLMDNYSWFRNDPSRVKAHVLSRAIPHNNSFGSDRNAYGAGRIDTYVSNWNLDTPYGWAGQSFSSPVDEDTWVAHDFEVPSDAERLVVVLTWDEPAASAGASEAVTYDLDLWLDFAPFSGASDVGEYSSTSHVDNVEMIRIDNPPTGSCRIKIDNFDAPSWGLNASVAWFVVRGDTSPTHSLTLSSEYTYVQPYQQFEVDVEVGFDEWIGSCVQVEIQEDPDDALHATDLSVERENGVTVFPDFADGDVTLGNAVALDSRECTYTIRYAEEGYQPFILVSDTDNAGQQLQFLEFQVDGTQPDNPPLAGSTPAPNTWTNDNTVFIGWDPAEDDFSGIDGYGDFWSESPTAPPSETKDLEETETSTTSPPLSEGDWYYKIKSVDNAGNWSESFSLAGPYKIDLTAPGVATFLMSTSHTLTNWSTDNTIDFTWTAAIDARSGLDGYGVHISDEPALPSPDKDIEEVTSYTTAPLPSGASIYFNLRAVDNASNWGGYQNAGPYKIDVDAPNPVTGLVGISHTVDAYSNNPLVTVKWGSGTDAHSGVAGYSITWTNSSSDEPDLVVDLTDISTTSSPLPDGDWWFHVRTIDNVGLGSNSEHIGPFRIDGTVPTNPTTLESTSHEPFLCSTDCKIDVIWDGGSGAPLVLAQLGLRSDPGSSSMARGHSYPRESLGGTAPFQPAYFQGSSGIAGYSIEWSAATGTVPDQIIDTTDEFTTSDCLSDGDWWFHLRTADVAGNWSSAVHLGPFAVDRIVPENPTNLTSGSHALTFWSSDNTIDATWDTGTDNCRLDGYSLEWTQDPSTIPDTSVETTEKSTTSPNLADGADWYLHVRSVDLAGSGATGAAHLGPFHLDTELPEAIVIYPNGGETLLVGDEVAIDFTARDGVSGVRSVRIELSKDSGATWPHEIYFGVDPGSPLLWTIPSELATTQAQIRVIVGDEASNFHEDRSDSDFAIESSTDVDVEWNSLPTEIALLPTSPNPVRNEATIRYALPEASGLHLEIFDVVGRRISVLHSGEREAGHHAVTWDGRDESGQEAVPGVYFIRMTTRDYRGTDRIVVVR